MASNKMFIPQKIKVGYQNRTGTYTGKLAYVIYFDDKGILRKEKSWQSWRDHNINDQEFENEAIPGFVLNKGVGGARALYGWNPRNEYIRVYDPRDFEFEISVANLLFILQETSSIKGKGLEGEFVYAWDGTELVLLPVASAEYNACKVYTNRQSIKLTSKDIKEGFSYVMKSGENVIYLGRYLFNNHCVYRKDVFNPLGMRHIFLIIDEESEDVSYLAETGFTKVAECTSSVAAPQFADELDKFKASDYNGEIKELLFTPKSTRTNYYYTDCGFIKDGDNYCYAILNYHNYRFSKNGIIIQKASPMNTDVKNGAFF